jgi:hypothetical protein
VEPDAGEQEGEHTEDREQLSEQPLASAALGDAGDL